MLGTMLTATAYTLLDRRRLQVRFPVLARLNWWQTILAAVVASLVAIVVTMLVGWQYTQPIAALALLLRPPIFTVLYRFAVAGTLRRNNEANRV